MSRARSLTEVAKFGLCSGCGLCAGAATPGAVRMSMTRDGYLRPRLAHAIQPSEHARLLAMCPGNSIELEAHPAPEQDLVWGAYHRLLKGHSTDEEIRFRASSGGLVSGIADFLLSSRQVSFILHVAADPQAPLRSRVQLSRSREEVIAAAGARYGPAAPLETIGDALSLALPFAVIGKPCDIAGIRNLAKHDPRVARLVRFTIAFFCAGVSSLLISESIVGKYGLSVEDVRTLRYRGHGCPGPTWIEAQDGRVFTQTYDATWSEELNEEIQFRCKICPDSTGEQADIVCGDAWVGVDGYAHAEHDGWDSIISRTARGDELLKQMEASGAIITEPLTAAALNLIQPHQVERKTDVLARLTGLALKAQPVPRFRGLRLLANGWAGRRRFLRGALGTFRRVGRGDNREDTRSKDAQSADAPARNAAATEPAPRGKLKSLLGDYLPLAPALLVMVLGVGLPLIMLLVYSVWTQDYVSINHTPTLANYHKIFERPLYATLLGRSLRIGLATTLATVVLAYPMAYLIAFHGGKHRSTLLVLVAVPFWTSYLLRIFAWKIILGFDGVLNSSLMRLGLVDKPLEVLLYNPLAVIITLTQAWLPFALLPLYVSLSKIDSSLREAAADLGDGAWHRFIRVIFPLSVPGLISAALLVFIPTVGDYVTPALVGGISGTLIGNLIQGQFGRANNWPMGAALSVITMLAVTFAAVVIQLTFSRARRVQA
jgi:ABC-type spermidine/putrescine transport system permease subunit I/coenzyme F420-reducing hydrogenase beta subunit